MGNGGLLGTFEKIWETMGKAGIKRENVGTFGKRWETMGNNGKSWDELGRFGIPYFPLEFPFFGGNLGSH